MWLKSSIIGILGSKENKEPSFWLEEGLAFIILIVIVDLS